MLYMVTGKPAHLGCKFLSDVSVVNSPIVVEFGDCRPKHVE